MEKSNINKDAAKPVKKQRKKAVHKDLFVEILKSKSRFISIFLIVALGVAFYAGVRSCEPDMKYSVDKMYDETAFMDIRLISTLGITDDDIEELSKLDSIENIEGINSADVLLGTGDSQSVIKVWAYSDKVNKPIIKEGRLPENNSECLVDINYFNSSGLKIGDKITVKSGDKTDISAVLSKNEYTITGTYTTSMYLSFDKGNTTIGNGKINGVIMVLPENFVSPYYTEAYLTVKGAEELVTYTDKYEKFIDEVKEEIEPVFEKLNDDKYEQLKAVYGAENLSEPVIYVLDRYSVTTYSEYSQDMERIGNIGRVIPMIFFIVAALVSLTTMTRMVDEQRTQIGTLKALGYSKMTIAGKYFWYALSATLFASVAGGLLGSVILPHIVLSAYKILYDNLEYVVVKLVPEYFIIAVILAVGCVVISTLAACFKTLMATPAVLMRPVAPKPGKRVFLEKIPFIWKHINFSRKSTYRNLLRYKKRLFMTLFGIGGCMSLLMVGFGIKDSINDVIYKQYDEISHYDMVVSLEPTASKEDYDELEEYFKAREGIEDYINIRNSSATTITDEGSISGYIFVTSDIEKMEKYFTFRHRNNKKTVNLNDDGVIITEKMGKKLGLEKGDTITIKLSDTVMAEAKVTDIVENYVYHNVFMTETLYEKLFGEMIINQTLLMLNDYGMENEESIAGEILALKGAGGTTYIDAMKNKFDEMLGSLDIVILVIIVSAGGLALVVLYNLNNINITERQRELATLKVLGFYDGEVSQYILRENIIITIVGIILGIFGGIILHKYVISTIEVDMVMFGREVKPLSYLYCTIITIFFAAIVNISMHFKLKKVDMATSLKSAE